MGCKQFPLLHLISNPAIPDVKGFDVIRMFLITTEDDRNRIVTEQGSWGGLTKPDIDQQLPQPD
jgi:hypothetical protein